MTRAEGEAELRRRGEDPSGMSDALVEWIATDDPFWSNGRRRGVGPRTTRKDHPLPPADFALLVMQGHGLAQREGMQDATLAALATIVTIGTSGAQRA